MTRWGGLVHPFSTWLVGWCKMEQSWAKRRRSSRRVKPRKNMYTNPLYSLPTLSLILICTSIYLYEHNINHLFKQFSRVVHFLNASFMAEESNVLLKHFHLKKLYKVYIYSSYLAYYLHSVVIELGGGKNVPIPCN